MDKWFQNIWFVRGVSLAFAILLYIVVVNEEFITQQDPQFIPNGTDEVQVLDDVPVDIRIDSDRFVVSGVPDFVTVSLEGSNSLLTPVVMQRSFTVFVDLKEKEEGDHTVELEYESLSSDISVYIEPKTIDVTIEERATEEYTVAVDFINLDQLPEGYELGEPEVNPGTITITSSKGVIEQIAMVKIFVDVADLTEPINNREVPVNVYDSQGNVLNVRVQPDTVVVSVDVDNPSKVVDINVPTTGELSEGFSLTSIIPDTEELEVFATTSTLEEIEDLSTEAIDLSKIEKTGVINTKLTVPNGVSVSQKEIAVAIEIEQTKEIDDVPIEVEDGQADRELSFIKPDKEVMNITVVGDEKHVSKLTAEDFRLFIDIKNLSEGEHKVPTKIESPDRVTVREEFDEVTIEIF